VEGVKFINECAEQYMSEASDTSLNRMKSIFGKSLAVNKHLKKGDVLTFDDLESKKPLSMGISAKDYKSVLGKRLSRNIAKWDFVQDKDLLPNE